MAYQGDAGGPVLCAIQHFWGRDAIQCSGSSLCNVLFLGRRQWPRTPRPTFQPHIPHPDAHGVSHVPHPGLRVACPIAHAP